MTISKFTAPNSLSISIKSYCPMVLEEFVGGGK